MAYRLAGNFVLSCNCERVCPCPFDDLPTAADGKCYVGAVFGVDQGNLGDLDLAGANFALFLDIRDRLGAGGWNLGMVVNETSSEEQAAALERIITGLEGGPFGDLAGLVGEFLGTKRAPVVFSNGDAPRGSVGGMAEIGFESFTGPDGNPTTLKNAMFGFAPEYQIGRGKGRSSAFGLEYDGHYGEAAAYEFVG